MEKIEQYYNNTLSDTERRIFEEELKTNPALAEEVAFWVQARAAAQAEAHARRKEEFAQLRQSFPTTKQRNLWYTYAAAASVVLILGIGWWIYQSPITNYESQISKEWAAAYVEKNFTTLNTQMGNGTDSLQMGVSAFNSGDLIKAKAIFEALLQRDSSNAEAQKYAGIVALRRQDYDQAIKHFHTLGLRTDLVANPGKFYEALALLQRDLPLDKSKAENLLKEIKAAKLDGWKEVE
jgi:tetratricopeptide (TPR) repeat protein